MKKEFIDNFLDPAEQSAIEHFITNDIMREAVRKVLLAGRDQAGVPKKGKTLDARTNPAIIFASNAESTGADDAAIGQVVRGYWYGIKIVEAAFDDMKQYLPTAKRSGNKNPAI